MTYNISEKERSEGPRLAHLCMFSTKQYLALKMLRSISLTGLALWWRWLSSMVSCTYDWNGIAHLKNRNDDFLSATQTKRQP